MAPFSRALLRIFSDLPEQRHQRVREDLEAEPGDHHGRPFHPGTHRGPLEKHPDAGECLKLFFTTVFSFLCPNRELVSTTAMVGFFPTTLCRGWD